MRTSVLRRAKAGWDKLKGQLAPGPTILLWHRVAEIAEDPHFLSVTPAHFEEQLAVLRQHYRAVSLAELTPEIVRGGRLAPVVVLTFDDGYADNATTALPLLRKHGLPATFFLASGFVGSTRECLQDDVQRLLWQSAQHPEVVCLTIGGKPFVWSLRSEDTEGQIVASVAGWNCGCIADPTPRHRTHREIHGLLRMSPPDERERVLDQLRSQCGDPGPARPTHRAMSWDQAREMASCELVELGAHTVNHPWLSALSLAEQRLEIVQSKRTLEEQTNHPVRSFAYPYGTSQSYTTETIRTLKEAGFADACSTLRGRIGGRTDRFQLPRLAVWDWDGDQFLRELRARRR